MGRYIVNQQGETLIKECPICNHCSGLSWTSYDWDSKQPYCRYYNSFQHNDAAEDCPDFDLQTTPNTQ